MKDEKEYTDDWNTLHCKCIRENEKSGRIRKEAADYRNNKMADYCEEMISKAKEIYYNTGDSTMSDRQYDDFEGKLKTLRPDSKILEKVGG